MKIINLFFSSLILMTLISCAKFPESCKGVLSTKPYLRDRNKAYSDKNIKIAEETYLYALLSANAYEEYKFRLPKSVKLIEMFDEGKGLQGKIYIKDNNVIIIAFRGSEGIQDWWFGNIWKTQYKLADKLINRIVLQYSDKKIIATGHSLGGGLALHGSLVLPYKIEAIVFNPSYRVHKDGKQEDNRRIVIAEKGDILKIQQWAWKNPDITKAYKKFYCTKTNNHSIYLLARCTMHVAAINNDDAAELLRKNPYPKCAK